MEKKKKEEAFFIKDKALTNFELEKMALGIKDFRGVFMLNTLPKKMNKYESGIVNLDFAAGNGTHWVTYRGVGKNIYYFDSF